MITLTKNYLKKKRMKKLMMNIKNYTIKQRKFIIINLVIHLVQSK